MKFSSASVKAPKDCFALWKQKYEAWCKYAHALQRPSETDFPLHISRILGEWSNLGDKTLS